jgi:hypothetical protein
VTTHLERLLFAQGHRCFFCGELLAKADASIEHLVASANGGTNADNNCVACCKTLNHLLGAGSIKEKLQIVLNQRGAFQCPARTEATVTAIHGSTPPLHVVPKVSSTEAHVPVDAHQLALVISDLRKRGVFRPRKVTTLTSTIRALFKQHQQKELTEADLGRLVEVLRSQGKLTITDNKVTYKLG